MHSGGAYGGHYFSFIKTGNKWLIFNDSIVKDTSISEI